MNKPKFGDKYTLLCKIGEGTFSEVFKCRQESTGKYMAAKKLKKTYRSRHEVENMDEIQVLRQLPPHPNLLPLIEYMFEPDTGAVFMVFELMDMNLFELIKNRKLSEARAKRMFYQILKGAQHLHSHDFFHRDIKPENVLVRKSIVKLSDVGSARSVHSRQPYSPYVSTRWYRSPETMLTSGLYGPKMDVWALGCVFYEMLTSRPLFPGESELDQLNRIHRVVGSPGGRLMAKMGRSGGKTTPYAFAPCPAMNLAHLLPFASEAARDVLKHAIVYDPDLRATVKRLLAHRYFADLREDEAPAAAAPTRRHHSTPALVSVTAVGPPARPPGLKKTRPDLKTSSWAPTSTVQPVTKKRPNALHPTMPKLPPSIPKFDPSFPKLAPPFPKPAPSIPKFAPAIPKPAPSIHKLKPGHFRPPKPLVDPLPKPGLVAKRVDQLRLNKIKANTVSVLPELHSVPAKRVVSFRDMMGSALTRVPKHLLPPIPEH